MDIKAFFMMMGVVAVCLVANYIKATNVVLREIRDDLRKNNLPLK